MGGKSTISIPTSKGIRTSSKMTSVVEDEQYIQAIKSGDMKTATEMVNNKGFERLPDDRLVGYRVSNYEGGKAISGADSRQSADTTPGSEIKFPGKGVFLASNPKHATDYYAVHDNNVIQKLAFKEADITSGSIHDKDPEVSVKGAEVLESEVFADGEEPKKLNQIEPITYDANNEIIPLSKRFDTDTRQAANTGGIRTSSKITTPNSPPSKPPISNIIPGNTGSATFEKNAKDRGMTTDEWAEHLDNVEEKMFELDANNEFTMSDDDFNKEIGDTVIENMKEQKAQLQEGQVRTLPNTGKVIVIGDLHEQGDNLVAILKDIQDNPKTNLDNNPDVKILFLGDVFSTTKSQPDGYQKPISGNDILNKTYSEVTNRLLTLLLAKYPDQIHTVVGNHDLGIITGNLYNSDPNFKLPEELSNADKDAIANDPSLSQDEKDIKLKLAQQYDDVRTNLLVDAQSAYGLTTAAMTNNEHAVQKLQNSAIAVITGDKAKGEKVRLFIHSPLGGALTPGLDGLKSAAEIEDILKSNDPVKLAALSTMFSGHGNLRSPQEIQATLNRLGVDEIYFGHVDPTGLISQTDDSTRANPKYKVDADGNYILSDGFNKTDNIKSPIGSIDGGAHLIDSQHKNQLSGYMVVDLDNDSDGLKQMTDVWANAKDDPAVQKVTHAAQNATSQTASDRNKAFGNIVVVDMMR